MKKSLSVILAVLLTLALSCSVFAEEMTNEAYNSGNLKFAMEGIQADITAGTTESGNLLLSADIPMLGGEIALSFDGENIFLQIMGQTIAVKLEDIIAVFSSAVNEMRQGYEEAEEIPAISEEEVMALIMPVFGIIESISEKEELGLGTRGMTIVTDDENGHVSMNCSIDFEEFVTSLQEIIISAVRANKNEINDIFEKFGEEPAYGELKNELTAVNMELEKAIIDMYMDICDDSMIFSENISSETEAIAVNLDCFENKIDGSVWKTDDEGISLKLASVSGAYTDSSCFIEMVPENESQIPYSTLAVGIDDEINMELSIGGLRMSAMETEEETFFRISYMTDVVFELKVNSGVTTIYVNSEDDSFLMTVNDGSIECSIFEDGVLTSQISICSEMGENEFHLYVCVIDESGEAHSYTFNANWADAELHADIYVDEECFFTLDGSLSTEALEDMVIDETTTQWLGQEELKVMFFSAPEVIEEGYAE